MRAGCISLQRSCCGAHFICSQMLYSRLHTNCEREIRTVCNSMVLHFKNACDKCKTSFYHGCCANAYSSQAIYGFAIIPFSCDYFSKLWSGCFQFYLLQNPSSFAIFSKINFYVDRIPFPTVSNSGCSNSKGIHIHGLSFSSTLSVCMHKHDRLWFVNGSHS